MKKTNLVGLLLAIAGWFHQPVVYSQSPTPVIYAVDWSPDGSLLAFGDNDGLVRVVNATTGEALTVIQLPTSHHSIGSVAWSPDGNLLAIGTYTGKIYIWDKTNGQLQWFSDGDDAVNSVDWSPDGTLLATGNQDYYSTGWYFASRFL